MVAHLNREDRIRRIAEILAKGIALLHAPEASAGPSMHRHRRDASAHVPGIEPKVSMGLDDVNQAIVEYLKLVGSASPGNVRERHGLSRTSVWRRLKDLEDSGVIVKFGSTRAVRYAIAPVVRETYETKDAGFSTVEKPAVGGEKCTA